jgi:hypothetical protein
MHFESAGHRLDFRLRGVFEVAARAKNLHALEFGTGNLPQEFRRQFSRYE